MQSRTRVATSIFLLLLAAGCVSNVAHHTRLRGGYQVGEVYRFREEITLWKFAKVHHPAEAGTHVSASKDLHDTTEAVVVGTLPAGTTVRIVKIEQVATPDTGIIIPSAKVLTGPSRDAVLRLNNVSRTGVWSGYPEPLFPDPEILEPIPTANRDD